MIIAAALSLILVGSVVGGTLLAIGSARDQGYLGGAIVVPEQYRGIIKQAAKRCEAVPAEGNRHAGFKPVQRLAHGARSITIGVGGQGWVSG